MRFSRTLIPTVREAPKGISDPAAAMMARAGFIVPDQEKKTAELLPMGLLLWERVIGKVAGFAREAGLQVVSFSDMAADSNSISRKLVKSYRQLPLSFLGGDLRRWDASGFAPDPVSALEARDAFLGISGEVARSAGFDVYFGETPGKVKKYVSIPCGKGSWHGSSGFICSSCRWCGDDSSPLSAPRVPQGDEAPLQEVETPGADTIAELCRQLGKEPAETLKTMFYASESGGSKEIIAVLARGDHQINDRKLSHVLGGRVVRFADPLEIRETVGDLAGYLGPVGLPASLKVLADRHVEGCRNLVVGANKPGFHTLNACWGRDFKTSFIDDLVSVQEDFLCPVCGRPIVASELSKVSTAGIDPEVTDLLFQDDGGSPRSASRWNGNLCITPLVFALAGKGKIPSCFAPLDVNVVIASMKNEDAVGLAHSIAERMEARGLRVLVDDRDERAGVKFSDAELLGIPVTIVAGREASESIVETWQPDGSRGELPADAAIEQAVRWVK